MKKRNIFRAVQIAFKISKPLYVVRLMSVILDTIVPILSAMMMTFVIDSIVYSKDYNAAGRGIMVFAIINGLYSLFGCFNERITIKQNAKVEININRLIIEKLSRVEYSFFDKVEYYNTIERASREIDKIIKVLDNLAELVSCVLSIIIIMPYIAKLSIGFVFLIVFSDLPAIVLQTRLKRFNANKQKEIVYYRRCVAGTNNMLINKVYAGEVRAFGLKDWLFKKFEMFYSKGNDVNYERSKVGSTYGLIIKIISIIVVAIIQLRIVSEVSSGSISIGSFTLYNTYIIKLNSSILQIVNCITGLYEKELFLDNLFSFIDGDFGDIQWDKGIVPTESAHEIEFKNVSFKYDNLQKNVLEDISFKVKAGQVLALVGLNGAGKTTIFNLILRFYRPQRGVILLDGKDINAYDIREYYKIISVVFQSPRLYPFSLYENISFNMSFDDRKVHDWMQGLINKYPKGGQTVLLPYLDPTGIEPSPGEVQRIGLERALYKDTQILLLDEPSASMDVEIEYKIFSDLKKLCKNKTAIIISHRLSAVTSADCIIVLKDAKILEQGTHNELMRAQGEYSKLFKMQSEKYNEKNNAFVEDENA